MRVRVAHPSIARAVGISDLELDALVSRRPNLLLEGKAAATDRMLRALAPELPIPVARVRCAEPLQLPRRLRGSLWLFGITNLARDDQDYLFDWLTESAQRVHVVSIASRPLYSLVERGAFRSDLYYRLAVVRLIMSRGTSGLIEH